MDAFKRAVADKVRDVLVQRLGIATGLRTEVMPIPGSPLEVQVKIWPDARSTQPRYFVVKLSEAL